MPFARLFVAATLAVLLFVACEDAVAPRGPTVPSPGPMASLGADPSFACSLPVEVGLLADGDLRVGTVRVANNDLAIYVTYETVDGWTMEQTALSVSAGVGGIPANSGGNPVPGRFPHRQNHPDGTVAYTYLVPLGDLEPGEAAVIAAYASVRRDSGTEGAWGEGEPIGSGGSWAMYFPAALGVCATESIGEVGGTVSFQNVALSIPPEALSTNVPITVVPVDLNELANPSLAIAPGIRANVLAGSDPLAPVQIGSALAFHGTAFDFGPDGLQFDEPATITIGYDRNSVLAAGMKEEDLGIFVTNGIFIRLESVVDLERTTVSAPVEHFSTFLVGTSMADLEVSLYAPTAPAKVGVPLEFGADVRNLGPGSTTGGSFTWSAFGDVTLVDVYGTCTEIPNPLFASVELSCPIDALDAGQADGIPVLRITPASVGTVEVWATVSSVSGAFDLEPDNDRQTTKLQVEPSVVADLEVFRLGEPAGSAKVGQTLEYQADVRNLGPDDIAGAYFTWTAFGDVTLGTVFGSCEEIADLIFGDVALRCPVGALANGQGTGVPVLRITPQSVGTVEVWGSISHLPGGVDPVSGNNRLTATAQVEPAVVADLATVDLLVPAGPAKVGQEQEYGANVQNLGPDDVPGATFTWTAFGDVTLGTVFGSCEEIADPIFGDVALRCPVGALASGQGTGVPVLRITPQSVGTVEVWGSIGHLVGGVDPDPDNNRLTTSAQVEAAVVADLMTAPLLEPSGPAEIGQTLEFGADVRNLGPDDVAGANFTWTAFGDVTLGTVFGFCEEIADPIFGDVAVRCPVGALATGQGTGIPVLRITPQSVGTVEVWGSISHLAGGVDPDTDNNRATATAQVEAGVTADLATIDLSAAASHVTVGASVEFAADVQNLGPNDVEGAIFTWTAFGNVALAGVAGSCSEVVSPTVGDVAVDCPVGALTNGQTAGIPVLQIVPLATGSVEVQGRIHHLPGGADPDLTNDARSAGVQVVEAIADLAITEVVEPSPPAFVGEPLEYNATVRNFGPDAAEGLFVWNVMGDVEVELDEVLEPCFAMDDGPGIASVECVVSLTSGEVSSIPALRFTPLTTGSVQVQTSLFILTGHDPNLDNNNGPAPLTLEIQPAP
jgi:hypothetical protein